MAPGRYELSEAQWQRIKDTLPGRLGHVGRTAADNRLFVNAVLWVLRSGARWHDLPERYGKYKSVHARFMRWARSGVWERIFADLVRDKKSFYQQRNRIERCFNALKHFRRFRTRYCRTLEAFRSTTALACAWIRLQLYVDTA